MLAPVVSPPVVSPPVVEVPGSVAPVLPVVTGAPVLPVEPAEGSTPLPPVASTPEVIDVVTGPEVGPVVEVSLEVWVDPAVVEVEAPVVALVPVPSSLQPAPATSAAPIKNRVPLVKFPPSTGPWYPRGEGVRAREAVL